MAKIWKEGQRRETPEEREERLRQNEINMALPYGVKLGIARSRIVDWYNTCREYGKTCHVSVGGLDSITLLALVREVLGEDIKGVSVSALEDKSIQAVHKEMGVIRIKPVKNMRQVVEEFGFPVISKAIAAKVSRLQVPGDDSPIIKAYMTGDEGAWGGTSTTKNSSCRTSGFSCLADCTRIFALTWIVRLRPSRYLTSAATG